MQVCGNDNGNKFKFLEGYDYNLSAARNICDFVSIWLPCGRLVSIVSASSCTCASQTDSTPGSIVQPVQCFCGQRHATSSGLWGNGHWSPAHRNQRGCLVLRFFKLMPMGHNQCVDFVERCFVQQSNIVFQTLQRRLRFSPKLEIPKS